MRIKDVINVLEEWAPPSLQESYDNSGIIVGDINAVVNGCLISLDCTEEVVQEAIDKNIGLIISHHPIVFTGLKSITGKNYIERVLIKAIQNNIAIYAIHTNLDNVSTGVNRMMSEKLELINRQILSPKKNILFKLVTYVPTSHSELVMTAMFNSGAGKIGDYDECSFSVEGKGTFRAHGSANPFVGEKDSRHTENEKRLEVLIESHKLNQVISAMKNAHPYEEVAYEIYKTENSHPYIGAGMVGELKEPMEEESFMTFLKKQMNVQCVRHTRLLKKPIQKIALCGGSGSFLLKDSIAAGADVFITGDFKYHDFFDAENKIVIMDVGHFESEQFTIELIAEKLQENFPIFAVLKTEVNTNPISYF